MTWGWPIERSRNIASTKAGWLNAGLWILLAAASILVLVLVRQNASIRESSREHARRTLAPYPGDWVPAVPTTTLDGDSVTLGHPAAGEKQLLFIMTTTCEFCTASLPAWRELADRARASGSATVLGVLLDSEADTRRFIATHGLNYPVVTLESEKNRNLYRIRVVPLTLVVDDDGQVVLSRAGAFEGDGAIDSVMRGSTWISQGAARLPEPQRAQPVSPPL